jgi:hypothetical protein
VPATNCQPVRHTHVAPLARGSSHGCVASSSRLSCCIIRLTHALR